MLRYMYSVTRLEILCSAESTNSHVASKVRRICTATDVVTFKPDLGSQTVALAVVGRE
jgi:hypothetical protein